MVHVSEWWVVALLGVEERGGCGGGSFASVVQCIEEFWLWEG